MMRTLRDKKTMQVILWLLIAAFVIGFLFLGTASKWLKGDSRDINTLAQVGDQKINYAEFDKVYQQAYDNLFGRGDVEPTQEQTKHLKEQVLDQLIEEVILERTAQKLGVSISMEDVATAIQKSPYFQDGSGKFDPDTYFKVLQQNNLTPAEFESSQQRQMLVQKIQGLLNESYLYTPADVESYRVFLNRDLKANYISLNTEAYEKNLKLSENDLKDYFDAHRENYDRKEQAKARHILISVPSSAGIADQAKAKQTLVDLRSKIQAGKMTFSAAASQFSQDTGSQKKGGELGWLDKGATVKEFDDALFRLKKGEISQPVQTKFGYHLIQLEDYQNAHKSTFSEVRSKVEKQYRQEKAINQILSISGQIASKLKLNENLGQIGKELSLSVSQTPWFNRRGDIPKLKGSLPTAEALSDLYPDQWKGPLSIGEDQCFFQISEERSAQGLKPQDPADQAKVYETFKKDRVNLWLKDYLTAQRKEQKVTTFLTD
jgi:peptidyl-prolyl cis-trans isomerase D